MAFEHGIDFNGPDLIDTINSIKDVLPKKQRQLCVYLLINYDSMGMVTVAELAERANVGTTTVMRLVKALKYDSFNEFKRDLLNVAILKQNSSYQNIKQAFLKPGDSQQSDSLTKFCAEATNTMRNFLTPKNADQFERAVNLLLNAKRINLLGQRSSKVAALYMEYALEPFMQNLRQLSSEPDFIFDKILHMQDGDVLAVVSNWPCGKNTMEVVRACSKRKIPIFLITNSSVNPIVQYCDIIMDTNSVNSSGLILPAIAIIEALVSELGRRTTPQSTENIEELEAMLRQHQLLLWQ